MSSTDLRASKSSALHQSQAPSPETPCEERLRHITTIVIYSGINIIL